MNWPDSSSTLSKQKQTLSYINHAKHGLQTEIDFHDKDDMIFGDEEVVEEEMDEVSVQFEEEGDGEILEEEEDIEEMVEQVWGKNSRQDMNY